MIYFRKNGFKIMGFYDDEIKEHNQVIENDKDNYIRIDLETHRKLYKEGMYKLKKDVNSKEQINIKDFDNIFERYTDIDFLEENTEIIVSPSMALMKLL